MACALARGGGLASDGGLDCIELGHPQQRLSLDRRVGRLMDLVEFTPHMRPAGREPYVGAELLVEPDLHHALEFGQMSDRTLGLAVGAAERETAAGGSVSFQGRSSRAYTPSRAGLGTAAAGIEYRDRVSAANSSCDAKTCSASLL